MAISMEYTKIYLSILHTYGHLYSSKGRRDNNPIISKVLDSIAKEHDITHAQNDLGDLYVYNNFKFKDSLLDYFNKI